MLASSLCRNLRLPVLALCALALILAGCSTPSEIPESLRYSVRAEDVPNAAFIHGTNRKDAFPLFDDHTACVMSVDHRTIKDERKMWSKDIPLSPGSHHLEVLYYHGAFISGADFDLEVQPNAKYELRFSNTREKSVDFWIVDLATGQPVTGISRGFVSGGGGGGFVPIFIPVK